MKILEEFYKEMSEKEAEAKQKFLSIIRAYDDTLQEVLEKKNLQEIESKKRLVELNNKLKRFEYLKEATESLETRYLEKSILVQTLEKVNAILSLFLSLSLSLSLAYLSLLKRMRKQWKKK